MDVVTELRDPRVPSGQEEDDEFQRPRGVRFHDEQKYPVSREEREEHELLGHVQYRSWCRHCAAARGVGQQHRLLSADPMNATVPEIVLDYYFMGEESETAPHIVVKDRKSSAHFSTSLDSKTSQYAVAFVAGAIQELGYKRILMKSDNEPSIKRLKERVSECLPGVECVPKEAPVGDSRANGSAENAVKQVKGQFRTLKTSTEDRYRCKIDAKSCLLARIPRHCANLMTRFKQYSDGRTAIQRLTGRRWGRPVVVFGERILVKVTVSRWWKRLRSCLLSMSSGSLSSSLLTFQFALGMVLVDVFKVFSLDSIPPRLWSRSLTFQFLIMVSFEVFKVFTQDRVQQRVRSRSLTFQFFMVARISKILVSHRFLKKFLGKRFKGFLALFTGGKKVRRLVRTRGRNCSPSRAHPRRWLSRRVSSWTQLVCGCSFQAVGGNFWAQIQKFGGLGEGWDGALVMRQPTTTYGRISSCFPVLCARAIRTWNLVHYFHCPCFWQSLFRVSGCCCVYESWILREMTFLRGCNAWYNRGHMFCVSSLVALEECTHFLRGGRLVS